MPALVPLAASSGAGPKPRACVFLKPPCQWLGGARVRRGRRSRGRSLVLLLEHSLDSLLKMLNPVSRIKHQYIYEGDYLVWINVQCETQMSKKLI